MDKRRMVNVLMGLIGLMIVLMIATAVVGIKMNIKFEEQSKLLEELQKSAEVTPEPVFSVGSSKYVPQKEFPVTIEVYEMLSERIAFEAGDDIQEMYAVGAVVLNRVESERFPDTVEDVLTQKAQFSPISRELPYDEHMQMARSVASDLLYNSYRPLAQNVLCFRAREYVKERGYTREITYQTPNLVFYTLE